MAYRFFGIKSRSEGQRIRKGHNNMFESVTV
jgi:hypothetical protein